MKFLKNIVLLAVVLLLSYFTAKYFGSVYDKFAPQHDSLFGAPKEITNVIIGIPFAYVFFVIFLFKFFGSGSKNRWIGVLLIPPALIWIFADSRHIYLPIILGFVAFGLAKLINILVSKLKHPNSPTVIK